MVEQCAAVNPVVPRIVVVIVDREKIEDVKEVISDCFYRSMCIINAVGTCRSELLDMLGVGSEEKALLAFFQPYFKAKEIMALIAERLEFNKPGGGIAFSLPLSGMSHPAFRVFDNEKLSMLKDALSPAQRERVSKLVNAEGEITEASLIAALEPLRKAVRHPDNGLEVSETIFRLLSRMQNNPNLKAGDILKSGEAETLIELVKKGETGMEKTPENKIENAQEAVRDMQRDAFSYDLIISIVNQGFSDDLMDAARAAGAGGGTVIQARGTDRGDTVKFFGISLQEEKEVVAILTSRSKRKEIMKALNNSCGISTEAAGVIFSLPVDGVAGIGEQ